jgi:hypothetical protein
MRHKEYRLLLALVLLLVWSVWPLQPIHASEDWWSSLINFKADVRIDQVRGYVGREVTASWTHEGGEAPFNYTGSWQLSDFNGNINSSPAVINGQMSRFVPQQQGMLTFQLKIVDSGSLSYSTFTMPITIESEVPTTIDTQVYFTQDNAFIGEPVGVAWTVEGGIAPYHYTGTWELRENSGTVDTTPAVINGQSSYFVPQKSGALMFSLRVVDDAGDAVEMRTYSIDVREQSNAALEVEANFDQSQTHVGKTVQANWVVRGGVTPYHYTGTWELRDSSGNTDTSPAVINGQTSYFVPWKSGNLSFHLHIEDQSGALLNEVIPAIPVTNPISNLKAVLDREQGYIGEAVAVSWTIEGGTAPIAYNGTWKLTDRDGKDTEFPAEINGQTSRFIPTQPGWLSFILRAEDSHGFVEQTYCSAILIKYRTSPIKVIVTLDKGKVKTGETLTGTWAIQADIPPKSVQCVWMTEDGKGNWQEYPVTHSGNSSTFIPTQGGWCSLKLIITDLNENVTSERSPQIVVTATLTGSKPKLTDKMLRDKVAEVAAQCKATASSDYARAKWFHDYLTTNASYDYTFTYYSAHGVLLAGTGVCDSFSQAYQMLLNAVGIANKRVVGKGNGEGHSWNLVNIDGGWYHVDVTWDVRGGHTYFMKSDDFMSRDHTWTRSKYPAAPLSYGERPNIQRGDATADGNVDIHDLLSIINYIINWHNPVSEYGADANGNGEIGLDDLTVIVNMLVK